MEQDPIRLLMERHGWSHRKAKSLVRLACRRIKQRDPRFGMIGTRKSIIQFIAVLKALKDTDHAVMQGLELDWL